MNPSAVRSVAVAVKGKGAASMARRARAIGARYGVGPRRMERRLTSVVDLVSRYHCGATLPVTAATVQRNPAVIARYAELGIEFAIHGHYHVDHARLSQADQVSRLGSARRILEEHGMPAVGFRAPYLRWNEATMEALREQGFLYDSSQAMHWPVDPELETDVYRRGLAFCEAMPASDYPVLPRIEQGLVRIPCCLPDDEEIIDRLRLTSPEDIAQLWLQIQRETYRRGELFTLQLHPERIEPCVRPLAAVLDKACASQPGVWIARLDEIARWWTERTGSSVTVREEDAGMLAVDIQGPEGLAVLTRGIEVAGAEPWDDGYVRLPRPDVELPSEPRPFIGVHPSSAPSLTAFLREQGYIAEISESPARYGCYLARERFSGEDERPLLAEVEQGGFPLLRLGRWPDGARSALSVTGDVDALTIWDYALRMIGR
jgi:peptidoglycan/xylan/chitin deacetylase (PgdA/CDA1 family)